MPDSCGGGFNGLNQKEFSKPPLSKKDKQKQVEAKRNAAKAKAEKRAKEEEGEEARARVEQERDPAEREAEIARVREAEENKTNARRLQNAQKKAAKACSCNDWVYALALYTECIEIDDKDHLHWSNRAAVQNKLGRFDEMLEDAAKCVELSPEFAKGWARVASANATLERYDAAEEAFRRALSLEPASTASLEGLAAVQKAREEATEEDDFDAMLRELKLLSHMELQELALQESIHEAKVQEACNNADAKEALVSLITAHRYIIDLAREDLADMDVNALFARALAEGLDEDTVSAAADSEDPLGELQTLIVDFLSHDLVGAATEVLAEAQFEEVSDDDADAVEEDLDFEIVALEDDEELDHLGTNDLFLAGAYIDQTHGELVLPNGIRLGHRSMHKYYKQRLRSQNDKQIVLSNARQKTINLHSRVEAKIARRRGWTTENRIAGIALKGARNASTSTAARKWRMELHNMKVWHNLHMFGGGGGGSHYWGAGSKQYNKGNKVKGVILRHSQQGAKMQAARNKANRSDASLAVLR